MTEGSCSLSAKPVDPLRGLQRIQAERLRELMKRRPGQSQYRRSLRAFLDADANLQTAILKRLSPD
jgi:hypothetical protein